MSRTFRNAVVALLAVLLVLYTAVTIHTAYTSIEVRRYADDYEADRDRLARQQVLDVLRRMQGAADAAVEETLAEVPDRRVGYCAVGEVTPESAGYADAVLRRRYQLDGVLPADLAKRLQGRLAEATEPVAYFNCRFTNMTNRGRLDGGVYQEDDFVRRQRGLGRFWYAARRIRVAGESGDVEVGVFLANGVMTSGEAQAAADEALLSQKGMEESATGDGPHADSQ